MFWGGGFPVHFALLANWFPITSLPVRRIRVGEGKNVCLAFPQFKTARWHAMQATPREVQQTALPEWAELLTAASFTRWQHGSVRRCFRSCCPTRRKSAAFIELQLYSSAAFCHILRLYSPTSSCVCRRPLKRTLYVTTGERQSIINKRPFRWKQDTARETASHG